MTHSDDVIVAKRLVEELEEEECELIIALTHMREPNDVRLARNIDGIHLILGKVSNSTYYFLVEKCELELEKRRSWSSL